MSMLFQLHALSQQHAVYAELRVRRQGWAVLYIRPDSYANTKSFWMDLLDALGRRVSPESHGVVQMASVQMAFAWLAAGDVDDVVIVAPEYLPPDRLVTLCRVTVGAGVRTWLLCDVVPTDLRAKALDGLAPEVVQADTFLARRAAADVVVSPPDEVSFPAVPDVHFLGFLTACSELLEPTAYETVRAPYVRARAAMRQRVDSAATFDHEFAAVAMHEICASIRDKNELLTAVRGAQAGAFSRGWNVSVDMERFAQRGLYTAMPVPLSPRQWEAVGHVRRPCEAAVAVLAACGLDQEECASLPASAVEGDGSAVHLPDRLVSIHASGQAILVAQHLYRSLVAFDGGEAFLVQGNLEAKITRSWVSTVLKHLGGASGIVFWVKSAQPKGRGKRWMNRIGVSALEMAA